MFCRSLEKLRLCDMQGSREIIVPGTQYESDQHWVSH